MSKSHKRFTYKARKKKLNMFLYELVEGVFLENKMRGLTSDQIFKKVWEKYRVSLTYYQIAGAISRLRAIAFLEPFDRKKHVIASRMPNIQPKLKSGNIVAFKKKAA
jgi:DNA-binding response OmpR family regulator